MYALQKPAIVEILIMRKRMEAVSGISPNRVVLGHDAAERFCKETGCKLPLVLNDCVISIDLPEIPVSWDKGHADVIGDIENFRKTLDVRDARRN